MVPVSYDCNFLDRIFFYVFARVGQMRTVIDAIIFLAIFAMLLGTYILAIPQLPQYIQPVAGADIPGIHKEITDGR